MICNRLSSRASNGDQHLWTPERTLPALLFLGAAWRQLGEARLPIPVDTATLPALLYLASPQWEVAAVAVVELHRAGVDVPARLAALACVGAATCGVTRAAVGLAVTRAMPRLPGCVSAPLASPTWARLLLAGAV